MKADPISVGKVLSENHRFVVPIYQRTYAWTDKKQLEPLFAQIEAKADERLQQGKVEFPHYMGSLLVIPEGDIPQQIVLTQRTAYIGPSMLTSAN